MEWQGGNKQRPNYWQWRRSFILGDSTGNLSKSVTLWTCIWAQIECSAGCDLWSFFFFYALSRAHRGVLVPTSLWLGLIDSLPFATVVFWLHLKRFFFFFLRKSMERKLLCKFFTATSCSTLARHALKLICQTTFDSILFKSLLSHAGQLSCCDVTEVTWPKRGIFSCRRRRCSKRRVCFHSNQYFYVPQENVNLSNEQCVC